jgi:sulfofructose kinase
MNAYGLNVDVLCVGHACYDLYFSTEHHFGPDEKGFATELSSCGGGPAANAAVTVSRLGYRSAFAGYLGNDIYGEKHLIEFKNEGVITDYITRGDFPTPLAVILVKPDGRRTVINYKKETKILKRINILLEQYHPKVMLFDGHEPDISMEFIDFANKQGIPTVLDAGSVHSGTLRLMNKVQYIVASERFAHDYTSENNEETALIKLNQIAPNVIITMGERGLIWKNQYSTGHFPAFHVEVVDTTGAGDGFHGAFAAGLADEKKWDEVLMYANAVGALCCTKLGARLSIPTNKEVEYFLDRVK